MDPKEDQIKETLASFLKELTELHEVDEEKQKAKEEEEKVNSLIVQIDERGYYLVNFLNVAADAPNEHLIAISHNELKRKIQVLNGQKRKEKQKNS